MSKILTLKKYPNQILLAKCQPVEQITKEELMLFNDMLYTMRHYSGLGLAASQVGVQRNLVVVDIGTGAIKLANPQVIKVKGKDEMEEGCLSVPGALVKVKRPYEIIVHGLNEQGKTVELKAKGMMARVILHEIDHLNGRLIVDYMNFIKKIQFSLSRKQQPR